MLKQDFSRLTVFQGLNEQQLELLDSMFERVPFEKDVVLFDQGQPARHLYILVSGEVVIRYKPYDGPALVVARIPPGGVFGWSVALSRNIYTSAAVAVTDGAAFRITAQKLHSLCEQYPETGALLMDHFASAIAERRATHSPILDILSSRMDTSGECIKRSGEDERKPQLYR